jgi:hypothetical protein
MTKYYISMAFLNKDNANPEDCEIKCRAIGVSNVSMTECIDSLICSRTRCVLLHAYNLRWEDIQNSRILLQALIKYNDYGMMPPCGARNGSVIAYVKGQHSC